MAIEARLEMELVPSSAWWSNVRSQVTPKQWQVCKDFVKARSSARCEICGGVGRKWPIECHEIWQYDMPTERGKAGLQTLVGLIALCPPCHSAKHIGRSMNVMSRHDLKELWGHILQVNQWNAATLEAYLDTTFAVWSVRSDTSWDLDVSFLETIGLELSQYVWLASERDTSTPEGVKTHG